MNTFLSLICSFFDLILIYIFIKNTMNKRKLNSSLLYIGAFIVDELMLLFFSSVITFKNATIHNCFIIFTSICLTFVLTLLHYGSLKQRLFVTFSFQVSAALAELVVGIVFLFLPKDLSDFLYQNELYGAFCSKILLYLFINIIILVFQQNKFTVPPSYTALILLMPILSMFLVLAVPLQYSTNMTQTVISSIVAVGILLANIVNHFLLQNLITVQNLNETKMNLRKQIDYQSTKYKQLSTSYRDTRRIIHDTKKHFFFIKSCLEKNTPDLIIPYLDDSFKDMEKTFITVNTGNLVIDSFLSNYIAIAKHEGIIFKTNIQVNANNIKIKDYDLSTILGNLLDNAMNACRIVSYPESRYISVDLFTSDKELMIHIENTFNNRDITNTVNQKNMNHGYGTQNIENTTLKYYGNYTHKIEQDIYHAIVSIPNLNGVKF